MNQLDRQEPSEALGLDALIEQYTPLAMKLARRYSYGTAVDEDLQQVALLGLVQAAGRFDADKGNFAAFAIPTITGTLKKHLRSTAWAVHIPRSVQERALAVEAASDDLTQQLRRAPTVAEIAQATGIDAEDVLTARRARRSRDSSELETHHPATVETDERFHLRQAMDGLDEDARQILAMRYDEDLTQSQIADRLGISQPQVYRRLAAITISLRKQLDDSEIDAEAPAKVRGNNE